MRYIKSKIVGIFIVGNEVIISGSHSFTLIPSMSYSLFWHWLAIILSLLCLCLWKPWNLVLDIELKTSRQFEVDPSRLSAMATIWEVHTWLIWSSIGLSASGQNICLPLTFRWEIHFKFFICISQKKKKKNFSLQINFRLYMYTTIANIPNTHVRWTHGQYCNIRGEFYEA